MTTESLDILQEGIEAELARQDRVLEDLRTCLAALGDVQIQLPQAFFDELEELGRKASTNINHAAVFSVRG